jgi:hypothetical protein
MYVRTVKEESLSISQTPLVFNVDLYRFVLMYKVVLRNLPLTGDT